MTVRDLAPYVGSAIQSILSQSYADFDFIIRDDGSTDGTRQILEHWAAADPRIRLFIGHESLGPAGSSNFVVAQSDTDLVARMDGDDLAHPDRLRRQLDVLDQHETACLVGSLWEVIDEDGRRVRSRDRGRLTRPSPFAPFPHGSIMYRRAAFDAVGGYRAAADFWEDLDLYNRMAAVGELLVIPLALYQHRASALSTRLTSTQTRVEAAVDRCYRQARGDAGASSATVGLLPEVFVSLGSTQVWAGRHPKVLGRMIRLGQLRFDRGTLLSLGWAIWAETSPRSLRFVLATVIRWRDRRMRLRVPEDRVVSWVPARPAAAGSRVSNR